MGLAGFVQRHSRLRSGIWPIDAFQQHAELRRREHNAAVRRRAPDKATLLQSLRK
jgi:hypothetical protein